MWFCTWSEGAEGGLGRGTGVDGGLGRDEVVGCEGYWGLLGGEEETQLLRDVVAGEG